MDEIIFPSGSAEIPLYQMMRRNFKQKKNYVILYPIFVYISLFQCVVVCMALKNGLFLTLVLNNYLAENSYEEVSRYFVMSIIFAEKENCFGLKNNFKINIGKLQKHKGSKCHVLANFNKCTSDISLFF